MLIAYRPEAIIHIDDNTRLNGAGLMAASGIAIGKDCILGSALLIDTDFHSVELSRRTKPHAKVSSANITIGNNVWLAGQSAVLKGVTIGDNSVVGASGVVTRDVEPHVVVVGNPARVVRQLAT